MFVSVYLCINLCKVSRKFIFEFMKIHYDENNFKEYR